MKIRKILICASLAVALLVTSLAIIPFGSAATNVTKLGNDFQMEVIKESVREDGKTGMVNVPAKSSGSYSSEEYTITGDISDADYIAVRLNSGSGMAAQLTTMVTAAGGVHLKNGLLVTLDGKVTQHPCSGNNYSAIPAGFDGYLLLELENVTIPGGNAGHRDGNKIVATIDSTVCADLTAVTEFRIRVTATDAKIGEVKAVRIVRRLGTATLHGYDVLPGCTQTLTDGWCTPNASNVLDYKNSGMTQDFSAYRYIAWPIKTDSASIEAAWSLLSSGGRASVHLTKMILVSKDGTITSPAHGYDMKSKIPANFEGYLLLSLSAAVPSGSEVDHIGRIGNKLVCTAAKGSITVGTEYVDLTAVKSIQLYLKGTGIKLGQAFATNLTYGEVLGKAFEPVLEVVDDCGIDAALGGTASRKYIHLKGNATDAQYLALRVKNGATAYSTAQEPYLNIGGDYTGSFKVKAKVLVGLDGSVSYIASPTDKVPNIPANFDGYILFDLSTVYIGTTTYNGTKITTVKDGVTYENDMSYIHYISIQASADVQVGSALFVNLNTRRSQFGAGSYSGSTGTQLTYGEYEYTASASQKLVYRNAFGTAPQDIADYEYIVFPIKTGTTAFTYMELYVSNTNFVNTENNTKGISVYLPNAKLISKDGTVTTLEPYNATRTGAVPANFEGYIAFSLAQGTGAAGTAPVNNSGTYVRSADGTKLVNSTKSEKFIDYVNTFNRYNLSASGNGVVSVGRAFAANLDDEYMMNKFIPMVTAPTANTLTYTGSAQALVAAGTTTGGTFEYSLDGTTWNTTLPTATNAGSYTVYYRVAGNASYTGVSGSAISVTIDKADATVTAPTANTLTYTGEAQALVAAGTPNGGTIQYKLDNGEWGTAIPTATNAGTYNVFFKVVGDDNHNDAFGGPVTVTIDKADATVTAPTANTLTYTGEAQALVAAGTPNGGTIQYKLNDGEWGTAIPTATNAGSYTVYYKVIGDANHNDAAEESVSVTIAKADATYTAPTANTLTYTGEIQGLINEGTVTGGTFMYSHDGNTWTDQLPGGTSAGSYTVYYKVVGDANHNDVAGGTLSVSIAKAAATVTAPTANTLTYTGEAQALVTAGTPNGGTIQYKLNDGEWGTAIPTATNAGSYTVYYKVVGDANHSDVAEDSVTVTIAKANATVTAPTANTLTYTGEAQALVTAGTANGGTIQYKLNDGEWGTAVPTATNAANYTVYYKVIGDANHNDVAQDSVTVTIGKTDAIITPPQAVADLEYTGSAITLITAGTTNGGTMEYSLDEVTWSTELPSVIIPGTYTVYYRILGDDNFNGEAASSLRVTVAQGSYVEPTPTPVVTPTPTEAPTPTPVVTTPAPTAEPTTPPTAEPTDEPTAEPTDAPTAEPTTPPTANPETGAVSVLALAAVAVVSGGFIVARKKND